ncbi:MAG: VCBS repeat-containing protein, partial [Verrucomicrobiae bacterium]|nr:VCBS repeat-containing protein [Verrucomicrobiae bacterium]
MSRGHFGVVSFLFSLGAVTICGQQAPEATPQSEASPQAAAIDENTIPPLAIQHCSGCHEPPRPGAVTRGFWPGNFDRMIQWMGEKNLPTPPGDMAWLREYYLANSPEAFTPVPDDFEDSTLAFEKITVGALATGERPKVSNVNIVDLKRNGRPGVLVCDVEQNELSWLEYRKDQWSETPLFDFNAAIKTAVFDFEGDGDLDIAVAALGYLLPTDDPLGEAHLLINQGDGTFKPFTLLRGNARVADIQPADFDNDGDTDFVVAMFGWRKTGGLIWLEQVGEGTFQRHVILEVNGPMRLQVLDFDGDGLKDFVVLISQQHESITLFRNTGKGTFENRILARARHPAFGSSSFQMVDLDRDGDVDILATNGDMMDEASEWKPFHGVRWFENVNGEFQIHELARMPGCYCARAADMDGDGDTDIVASSMNFFWEEFDFPSLIWLEN